MLKVKSSALTVYDGITYCLGARFSGTAFYIAADGKIDKIIDYLHGNRVGEYKPIKEYDNDRLTIMNSTPSVDADFLQSGAKSYTGEPYLFKGEPFTGIVYRFRGEFCTEEVLYLEGYFSSLEIGTEWYLSGVMKSLALDRSNKNRANFLKDIVFTRTEAYRGEVEALQSVKRIFVCILDLGYL